MDETYAIRNVHVFEDGQVIPDALLIIDQGRIRYAGSSRDAPALEKIPVMEGQGGFAAPGFIDLQLNGGYGKDFTENPASLLAVARRLPETGVTAFLPTFITSPLDAYESMLREVTAAQEFQALHPASGARILGAHIEGPFLAPARKGAHRQEHFRDPDPSSLEYLQPLSAVRLLTLAAERPGALEVIRILAGQGVVVSIGHSDAGADEAGVALAAGATYATHLYNAMRPMQHRDPGLVGTLLVDDRVINGLIVDGVHVHASMVKLAYRSLGMRRITLVTDAMAAMGMPAGVYSIGGQTVNVDASTARLQDGTLAGSILRMDEAVRNMIAFSGCTPAEAVRMASTTPAEVLGIDGDYGHLLPGFRADFTLLNEDLTIQGTFIDGKPIF